jgi:hypothetical protein
VKLKLRVVVADMAAGVAVEVAADVAVMVQLVVRVAIGQMAQLVARAVIGQMGRQGLEEAVENNVSNPINFHNLCI